MPAQAAVGVIAGRGGEGGGGVGAVAGDLAERVDRCGSQVGIKMGEELDGARDEQVLAGPTGVVLAGATGQRMQGPAPDLDVASSSAPTRSGIDASSTRRSSRFTHSRRTVASGWPSPRRIAWSASGPATDNNCFACCRRRARRSWATQPS